MSASGAAHVRLLALWCVLALLPACSPRDTLEPAWQSQPMASWTACYDSVTSRRIPVLRAPGPRLLADAEGRFLAVWIQCQGSRSNAWSSRFHPASGWSVPQPIGTGSDDRWPALAVNPAGEATALWSTSSGVWENRFAPASGWGLPRQMDIGDFGTPDVFLRSDGNAVTIWASRADPTSALWASRRLAGVWSQAEALPLDVPAGSLHSAVGSDAHANITAAWSDPAGGLWTVRYEFDSGWATPASIDVERRAVEPALSVASDGVALLAWRETPSSALLARRFVPGAGWGAALRVDMASNEDPPYHPKADLGPQGGGCWRGIRITDRKCGPAVWQPTAAGAGAETGLGNGAHSESGPERRQRRGVGRVSGERHQPACGQSLHAGEIWLERFRADSSRRGPGPDPATGSGARRGRHSHCALGRPATPLRNAGRHHPLDRPLRRALTQDRGALRFSVPRGPGQSPSPPTGPSLRSRPRWDARRRRSARA